MVVGLAVALIPLGSPTEALAAPPPSRWCGTDEASVDRLPDVVASYQVHVVYAFPSDGTDRFFQLALPIARDLALVDTWWRLQDPTRTLRFDLHAFAGCDSTFGGLDISVIRLAQPGATYAALDPAARLALVRDLRGVFTDSYKKYAVYYDGPLASGVDFCGFSSYGPETRGPSFSFTLLQSDPTGENCGSVGAGDYMSMIEAHEMIHNLGAVSPAAPHQCEDGHACDAPGDIMRSFGVSNSLFDYALDIGRDDYYGHSGSWWDVQDSPWLSHLNAPQFTLTVSSSGSGEGSVTSDLPGISCPPACSLAWDSGTQVTLSPSPEGERSRFARWTGACGESDLCQVTMDSAKSVGAEFVLQTSVAVSISRKGGSGRVTSNPAGIDCPSQACQSLFDAGSKVVLTAAPDRGSRFVGWSGRACLGRIACMLTADSDASLVATFGPGSYRLTALVAGQGRVRSTPAGISCTRRCSAPFRYGTLARFTAEPARGWRFTGWSGGCRGTGRCVVRVTRVGVVRATFRPT